MTGETTVAVVAAIVAAGAAIASAAIGGLFAVRTARQAGGQRIAELRQEWIDGLRDDLATVLSLASATPSSLTSDQLDKQSEARGRIILRLNPNEQDHIELSDRVDAFVTLIVAQDALGARKAAHELIASSRRVLKREWNVVKTELKK